MTGPWLRVVGLRGLCAGVAAAAMWMGTVARAASFDCKLAKSPQEKAICASPELSRADETLTAAYKTALRRDPAKAATVKTSQLGWLQETALRCHARVAAQPTLAACMLARYNDRIATLQDGRQHVQGMVFSTGSKTLHFENTIDDQPSVEGNTKGTLNASWPVADSKAPEWLAWNAAVEQAARDMSDSDWRSETGHHSLVWRAKWAKAVDADVTPGDVSVQSLGPALGTLVSVRIENDFMGFGAAHPGETWTHFHWLLEKKRELKAEDIFAPGLNWKAVFTRECVASLRQQQDVGYDASEELKAVQEEAPKPENWSVDTDGITVEFPEYTVSPRVAPVDPVLIRWTLLKPFLANGFEPPR